MPLAQWAAPPPCTTGLLPLTRIGLVPTVLAAPSLALNLVLHVTATSSRRNTTWSPTCQMCKTYPTQLPPPIAVRLPARQVTLMGGQLGAKHQARRSGVPRMHTGGLVPIRLSWTASHCTRGPLAGN